MQCESSSFHSAVAQSFNAMLTIRINDVSQKILAANNEKRSDLVAQVEMAHNEFNESIDCDWSVMTAQDAADFLNQSSDLLDAVRDLERFDKVYNDKINLLKSLLINEVQNV